MSAAFRGRDAQRGLALILLLVVVVLAFTYVLISRLPLATRQTAAKREYNGKVLNQAKQALIGWMVINAAGTDDNPGRLPCPEGVNNIGSSEEGIAAPYPGSPGPPVVPGSPNCATVGRLPWRSIGIDKLVDADAEPLWYAVSPGWSLQSTSTLLTINSDKRGQMTVDGQAAPNDVVALVIAPGRAMNVQAAPGCAARAQARAAPAPAMNPADYIECFNAATPAFSTVGPATSFNDQVLAVTAADLIPPLEAAIQQRMQREIAPALKSVYGGAEWGQTAGNPVFPFAARFNNPHPGADTYQGEDGRYQGLLPFTSSIPTCGADPRCSATFVNWNGSPSISISNGSFIGSPSCSISGGTIARCTGTFLSAGTATFRMSVKANNVAMALRTFTPANTTIEVQTLLLPFGPAQPGTSGTASFNNDGSADFTLRADAAGLIGAGGVTLNTGFRFTADMGAMLADHSLLDPSSTNPTGWFVRNEWYRLVWYAAAARNTVDNLSSGVPSGCTSSTTPPCLGINNGTRNIRSLLVLAGRSLNNPAGRPNGTLSDYLEFGNCDPDFFGNCTPNGTMYEQRWMRAMDPPTFGTPIKAPFNDRVVLVDWIAPPPTFPIAVMP